MCFDELTKLLHYASLRNIITNVIVNTYIMWPTVFDPSRRRYIFYYIYTSANRMGRKQHQGDKLWLTTQEWKYFFGGKKPGRKADPDEVR